MKKRSMYRRAGCKIITAALFVLFTVLPATGQKIEFQDGVRLVHNEKPKLKSNEGVALKYFRTIGGRAEKDKNLRFYQPRDAARDKEGSLYILDSGNHRIQKFDSAGVFLSSIGEKGIETGQLLYPVSIDIDADGNIFIADPGNNRILSFSPDGTLHKSISMTTRINSFCLLTGNETVENLYSGSYNYAEKGETDSLNHTPLLRVRSAHGDLVRMFGIPEYYSDMRTTYNANKFFMTAVNNEIFIAFAHRNEIDKYSADGKLLMKIDRKLDYEVHIEKGSTEKSGDREFINASTMAVVSEGIAVDDRGRIWVLTYRKQPEKINRNNTLMFEIFDIEGLLLKRINFEDYFENPGNTFRIFGDRLFIVETTGRMCVHEFKINEN